MTALYPHIQRLWKPYLFTSVSVSLSMLVGDYICQRLELQQKRENGTLKYTSQFNNDYSIVRSLQLRYIDTTRIYASFMTGFFVNSIFGHTQQRIMEYYMPGKSMRIVLSKMLTGCFLAPFNIGLSFSSILYFQGGTSEQITRKLQKDLTPTWAAGVVYWPVISFINFRYVHLNYRAALGSLAGAVWAVYISRQANKQEQTQVIPTDTIPVTTT